MPRPWTPAAVLALAATLVPGCATVIDGSTEKVYLTTDPPGAEVTLNGEPLGTTPLSVPLDRWDDGVLTFTRDGYRTVERRLESRFNESALVNIVWLVLCGVPFLIDLATGAIFRFEDSVIQVTMAPA